jgi:CheY-like chemotaxis protein
MTKRVLVVDDEFDTLMLLQTILEIHGFHPLATHNSIEALSLAETGKAEVAILDIMMPKLDGFTLCKLMRDYPATANLPIIFLTAYSALDLEERRKQAGADYVLHKPIDLDKLVDVLENAASIRQKSIAAAKATPPARSSSPKPGGMPGSEPKSAPASDNASPSNEEPPSSAADVDIRGARPTGDPPTGR